MALTKPVLFGLSLGLCLSLKAVQPSPFLPTGTTAVAPTAAPGTTFELRGIMSSPDGTRYCIYDPSKKTSLWVGVNETGNPFTVTSADANGGKVTLDVPDGRHLSLELKQAKTMSLAGGGPMPIPQPIQPQPAANNGAVAPVILNPTPQDEQRRLQMIADEVRRRRLLREQQQGIQPAQPPQQPGQPGHP